MQFEGVLPEATPCVAYVPVDLDGKVDVVVDIAHEVCKLLESNKEAGGGAQGAQGASKICTSRESVSPLSRLIRGFRNKYH